MAEEAAYDQPGYSSAVTSIPIDRLVQDAVPDYGVDTDQMRSSLADVARQKAAATDTAVSRQLSAQTSNYDQLKSKLEGISPVDVQPWDADKEKAERVRTPLEDFGSMAGIFAMLASSFTKMPMDNALNAGAAAINSSRAADMDGYDRAHTAWKENTDLALKRHEVERQAFKDAEELYKTDPIAGGAELKAVAARFGAKAELALIDSGYVPQVFEMQKAKADAAQKIVAQIPNLDKMDLAVRSNLLGQQAIKEENNRRATIGQPPLSAQEQANLLGDVRRSVTQSFTFSGSNMDAVAVERRTQEIIRENPDISPLQARNQARQEQKDAIANPKTRIWTQGIANAKKSWLDEHPEANGVIPSDVEAKINTGYIPLNPDALRGAAFRYINTGTLPPQAMRGGQAGQAMATDVQDEAAKIAKNELHIDMADLPKRWQKFKAAQVAIQRFESGPQGNIVRSLNVAIDHLSTVDQLAAALKNGNVQVFNRIAQGVAQQTGSPIPTNLDAAKSIVGPEIIKALGISNAGTASERMEAQEIWNKAKSPEQLAQATATIKKLLGGQMRGMRQQYVHATGLSGDEFNMMLLPETLKQLEGSSSISKESSQSGGWSIKRL